MKIKKLSILIIAFSLSTFISGQKYTFHELGINNSIRAFYNSNLNNPNSPYGKKLHKNKALLTLPFIDDFSQYNIFPDQNLWEDMHVHINSNYADNPVTYGVATFDGLDSTGRMRDINPKAQGISDYLTSKPINLSTVVDSVYLSFYYQPQGNGNMPETEDSLSLEFFRSPDKKWITMWSVPGSSNHSFKKIMVPVDITFQTDSFQFRFRNKATLSGSLDHWNIDYVYLDDSRNIADTALFDVSFITNHYNMLKEFSSMPWSHYKIDSLNNMKTALDVVYKNNDKNTRQIFYHYDVISDNGTGPIIETYPTTVSSKNVNAYSTLTEPQAVFSAPLNDFYFPIDNDPTKVFQIKNYFNIAALLADDHVKNDTVVSYQVFASHYAYDDGSAEIGFSIKGSGTKIAHEFNIKKSDTLTSFQVYFSPLIGDKASDLNGQTFRLKVWSSLSPEVEIYSQPATAFTQPDYTNTNEFSRYKLDIPLYLSAGTYYFGWENITNDFLTVGWDVNTNNKQKVHINGLGVWETIPYDGSFMLRPTFGSLADPAVNINEKEQTKADFKVYPNPASDIINFNISNNRNNNTYNIELLDIYGNMIINTTSALSNKIDINNISSGIYIIQFTNNETTKSILKKVIISK